ncbi:PREDICTED: uncharacterized protein LOC109216789 [Nicotiana attenuata]|uniref:Uncharacterized protein n=1 Tax=Nicotiana attenuata TaxID=49451 RepID=A0A1J6KVF0_NICAT|nr:PREDICTED: uncharacterized protein LOC109216789 [Nicotiana attenuata]OIT23049.1 hypothetical protein A4A49_28847 [Nicotiana attenuata]
MVGDGVIRSVNGMKAFLWFLLLLSLLWLVFNGSLAKQATATTKTINLLDVWKTIQTERHYLQKNSNLNYASARRASTGLNAIRNRKAGKAARAATKIVDDRAIKSLDVWKIIEAERQYLQRNPNINYVSKRRVPTGPNAIHNRKIGKYREPPTRA